MELPFFLKINFFYFWLLHLYLLHYNNIIEQQFLLLWIFICLNWLCYLWAQRCTWQKPVDVDTSFMQNLGKFSLSLDFWWWYFLFYKFSQIVYLYNFIWVITTWARRVIYLTRDFLICYLANPWYAFSVNFKLFKIFVFLNFLELRIIYFAFYLRYVV